MKLSYRIVGLLGAEVVLCIIERDIEFRRDLLALASGGKTFVLS
jgi:hypothetical protein